MKFLPTLLFMAVASRSGRRNFMMLLRFFAVLLVLIIAFTVSFHVIMEREGRNYSWLSGLYWTLVTMSTLGFGDITFHSDLGRLFSLVVLVSGVVFLLVLMPFTFIEFFYAPWMKTQAAARAPTKLPPTMRNHVVMIHLDAVSQALISRLRQYRIPYVLIISELSEALQLHDQGYEVMLGDPDSPATYENARIDQAALLVATDSDTKNTNAVFTAHDVAPGVPIVATAGRAASEDILMLAGCSRVLQLPEMMGQALARRTIGGDSLAHPIGNFEELIIAEATVAGTPLIGKTVRDSRLRELSGVTVVGVWERGKFELAGPETRITAQTVLILAGTQEQIDAYDALFCIYHVSGAPVVIIGGGRVGRAVGAALAARGIDYRIVEPLADRIKDDGQYVHGSAADLETLQRAGLMESPAVVITTREDDLNIYLTIYCRRLRQDIQIISRSTLERNVSTLHRAGADFVLSYASMGANMVFNLLRKGDVLLLAEGLYVLRVPTPPSLVGLQLMNTPIRAETGCSVLALGGASGKRVNPPPNSILQAQDEMILIGTLESEDLFLKKFAGQNSESASRNR